MKKRIQRRSGDDNSLMVYGEGELLPVAREPGEPGGQLFIKVRVRRQAQEGGACTGEEEGHAAAVVGQLFRRIEAGDQGTPEGLVELIAESHGDGLRIAVFQGPQQHGGAGDIEDGVAVGDLLGQDAPGQVGGELEIRDQGRAAEALVETVPGDVGPIVFHKGGNQAAENGGGQVIRVALDVVAHSQQLLPGERGAVVCVGTGGAGGYQGGAAAQAPANGNVRPDGKAQARHGQAQLRQHGLIGDHGQVFLRGVVRLYPLKIEALGHFLKGEGIIQGQSQAQGIEAGA